MMQEMLSDMLRVLGFEAMASDVKIEQDQERLRKYARVIIKNSPSDKKMAIHSRFAMLRLV